MRNYIILNGINSNTISGLLIEKLAPISKPLIRTQIEEIDGRDGDIVTKLGFSAYDKEITVGLYGDFDINEVIAFFNSEGTVIFSNEPDKYYNYQIIDQIDFERLVRYRTAKAKMHCQPFKYSTTEEAETLGNNGTVSGEGSALVLEDTAEAPFNTLDLKGNAEQTTYSGKNLLPSINTTRTRNGVTFTHNEDGSISLSGTASADTAYPINVDSTGNSRNVNLSAGNYIVSGGSATSPTTVFMQAYYGTVGGADRYSTSTFTLEADGTMGAYIYVKSGANTTGKTIYPMVEQGSTATDYEPYVGGTPAPNPNYPQPISTVTGAQTITITGKNLLDNSKFVKGRTDNGVIGYESGTTDLSYADNSISFTTGTTYRGVVSGLIHAQPSTEYHFKATTNDAVSRFVDAYDTAGAWISRLTTSASGMDFSFTTPSNCGGVRISFQRPTVGSATLSDLMLELGSTATAYEPYQGQSYEVNLGKNLCPNPLEYGIYNENGVKSGSDTGSVRSPSLLEVTPSTQYIFSCNGAKINTWLYEYDANGAYISGTRRLIQRTAFTTGSTTHFVTFFKGSDTGLTGYQLEQGSTVTPYAPYFDPIELAKVGTYQDRIYKNDGKWYIEKNVGKVVLTGANSENWQYTNNVCYTDSISDYSRSDNKPLSDNFTTTVNVASAGSVADNTSAFGGANLGTQNRFYVKYTSLFSSAATIETWLGTHNTTVYYALDTSTTTEITNETLIGQLEAIDNQAHAYKGRTHVTALAATGNAPHIIAAEVQTSSDGTITNSGNYISKPKLTIYGSGNIGVYLNGYQMFDIALGDEGYITIDTNAMEAYKDTPNNLKNRLVTGEYENFALQVGENQISFSGIVSKCIVENYSRWL